MSIKYEKLEVWQRSKDLCSQIYNYSKKIDDYGFRNQITRSSLSVPSNLAEGFERESIKDSINFFIYAKASCGELRTQIYVGADINYIEKNIAEKFLKEVLEISSMISGLIKTRKSFLKQK
jgi:four helix bundle protein